MKNYLGQDVPWSEIPMMGAADIETTGLDYFTDKITLVQYGTDDEHQQWYTEEPTIEDIKELQKRTLFWHNGKFDTKFIAYHFGIMLPIHGDSMVLLHALGYSDSLSLKVAASKLLGVENWDIEHDLKLSKGPDEEASKLKFFEYGLKDVKYTYALMRLLLTGVNSQSDDPEDSKNFNTIDDLQYNVYNNELKAYSAFRYIEMTGTPLGDMSKSQDAIDKQIEDIENKWGFRFDWVNSSDKVGALLSLVDKRLKPGDNGKISVTKEVLTKHIQEVGDFAYDVKEVRKLKKLIQFFDSWNKLGHDGRIFPQFNITTKTGRTSSSNPNLQQVPQDSRVRNIIAAPKGMKFIECDYSQLELRCAAYCAQEPAMMEAYKHGADLHTKTWESMNGRPFSKDHDTAKRERTIAKACFSGDTEILTPYGWVKFEDYNEFMKCAQYDEVTGKISFTYPNETIHLKDQDIWVYEDTNTSIHATGNHDILIQKPNGDIAKEKFSNLQLLQKGDKHRFINAGYVDSAEEVDTLMQRLVAFTTRYGQTRRDKLHFAIKKPRYVSYLIELLDDLEVIYHLQREYHSGQDFYYSYIEVDDSFLLDNIREFLNDDNSLKYESIPKLGMPFLEAFKDFGHLTSKNGIVVKDIHRSTLDVVQQVGIRHGIKVRINGSYTAAYNLAKGVFSFPGKAFPTGPSYKGDVYCVNVPTHNIVIRHNDKVSIQGNCNFSLLYGAQSKTLRDYARTNMGIDMSQEDADEFHRAFFESYPGLVSWHNACKRFLDEHGYIQSPLGRRRYLPTVYSKDWGEKESAYRRSINTPVQGLGSDICVSAMTTILQHPEYGKTFFVHGTIHDAILVTAYEDQAEHVAFDIVKKIMEHPPILDKLPTTNGLYLIADADVTDSWGGEAV